MGNKREKKMGLIATDSYEAANGSIVYWRIAGGVSAQRLTEAWAAAGLDAAKLPRIPEPLTTLRKVLKEIESEDNVKSVERDTTTLAGFAVLKKLKTSSGKAMWVTQWEALLDANGALVLSNVDGTAFDEDLAELLHSKFELERKRLPHTTLSVWLVSLVHDCAAVGLRENGGLYFVPKPNMPLWHKYVGVLNQVSKIRTFEIPALTSTQAAEAVLDALMNESQGLVEKIDDEIETVGVRALRAREQSLDTYLNKLASYTSVVGDKLAGVQKNVEELKNRLAAAIISNLDI